LELTCYVNADFCGTWDKKHSQNDPDTAQSRSRFVVFLSGAPIVWQSKLQTMIALSMAESKLIALSEATCFIQSLSYLINELHEKGMVTIPTPQIFCRIFEDDEAALEISKVPKV
jgi:hypothetical protein